MAAGDGLISMKPTSIVHAGTSASINADGGVDFTAVTSLSLNGVFTSDYDNYLIVIRSNVSAATPDLQLRWRSAGTDNSTASSYVFQRIRVGSTSVDGSRTTSNIHTIAVVSSAGPNGLHFHVYGPALAQPTASRGVSVESNSGARILDYAGTHNQSTSYDGFTLSPSSDNITGNVHVFGYEE